MLDALAFLPIGFLIGMAHAVEADHLAAVATMMDRKGGRRALIARGAFWGLGHTLALFFICTAAVLFGLTISGTLEAALELVVGLMILGLGAQVLWRLRRERLHVHVHSHGDHRHIHMHSHAGEAVGHDESAHAHRHAVRADRRKAALVGLVHGAAGSAGLLVLMVATTQDVGKAIVYFAVFGLGSMAGMTALTALVSYPLVRVYRGAAFLRNATTGMIGAAAVGIGSTVMLESMAALQPGWF